MSYAVSDQSTSERYGWFSKEPIPSAGPPPWWLAVLVLVLMVLLWLMRA